MMMMMLMMIVLWGVWRWIDDGNVGDNATPWSSVPVGRSSARRGTRQPSKVHDVHARNPLADVFPFKYAYCSWGICVCRQCNTARQNYVNSRREVVCCWQTLFIVLWLPSTRKEARKQESKRRVLFYIILYLRINYYIINHNYIWLKRVSWTFDLLLTLNLINFVEHFNPKSK